MEAHQLIASVTTTHKEEQKNVVDSGFSGTYALGERMANTVATSVGIPQITGRQQHCTNPVSNNHYFKRGLVISCLHHLFLNSQFSESAVVASISCSRDASFDDAVSMYE